VFFGNDLWGSVKSNNKTLICLFRGKWSEAIVRLGVPSVICVLLLITINDMNKAVNTTVKQQIYVLNNGNPVHFTRNILYLSEIK